MAEEEPSQTWATPDPELAARTLTQLATTPLRVRGDNLIERPWGGRRLLAPLLANKGVDAASRPRQVGESFEISADPGDPEAAAHPSIVEFADGSSMSLPELLQRAGESVLGSAFFAAFGPRIPLLPKLLGVEGLLSVQSHPPGNPEVYVVIAADPGATVRIGFREPVDAAAMAEELRQARRDQEALLELLGVPGERLGPLFAELLGKEDAVARLSLRLAPLLHSADELPRLRALLESLDSVYRSTLDALNTIPVEPGMVLFNAHPPGARHPRRTPSAQVHCLGNPEGKAVLLLEIRRPGVTYRAWDHARFPLRELAIDQAFEAMHTGASSPADFIVEPQPVPQRQGVFRSVECPAFMVDHLRPGKNLPVHALCEGLPTTLHGVRGVARLVGPGEIDWGTLRGGESLLLPAGLSGLRIESQVPDTELVQVSMPIPVEDQPARGALGARRANLAQMREIVARSQGPGEVLAIVNPGDASEVEGRLQRLASTIFRADGKTRVFVHEEARRRGQLLGLLDALRHYGAQQGRGLDPQRVALGIMMPGKGTRLSPLTQRLHGIKPFFPVPIRVGEGWLDGASASLWSWVLITHTLERQGFRGAAWKWGDEPQIPAIELARFDADLSDADAVRFGAATEISEDLAANKEWLKVDPATDELIVQVRRRERGALLERLGLSDEPTPTAHVHVGSPAFSHLFLRHAEEVFGACEDGWLDVDGYLFEALTHEPKQWAAELERDPELRAVLDRCPDFYEKVRELRRRIEAERGHPMRIVVIDLGAELYWGDVGQLDKARAVWADLAGSGEETIFARALAGLDELAPDAFGNLVVGNSKIPTDGSVRGCVIIDSTIEGGLAEGATVVESRIGLAGLERGAVVLQSRVKGLRMAEEALSFRSVGEFVRVPAHHVHTSIVADPRAQRPVLESWMADMREDPSAPGRYDQPCYGNPMSFAAKFNVVRQREVPLAVLEAKVAAIEP